MNETLAAGVVRVRGSAAGFSQEITAGRHRLVSDEPVAQGGTDTGPSPYDLLLAALGACTSMTIALYARRKGWPLTEVSVHLRHHRVHAQDCADCETNDGTLLDLIERDVSVVGELSQDQRARIMEIADRCPVHRTLTSEVKIQSRLV